MTIELLNESIEKAYDDFLLTSPDTLLFASNKYRKLLKKFLNEEDFYFVAIDQNKNIVGALPAFLKKNALCGNILNSLPFYGSNGGVIEFENNIEVRKALVGAFYSFARENNCVASTLVSSSLEPLKIFYDEYVDYTCKDSRIGQVTPLPLFSASADNDEMVMKLIDSKMRNLIRKAQKLEIKIGKEERVSCLDFLITTHQENLAAIGGIAKSENFFKLVPEFFIYGSDYKIYYAKKDGQLIAALLLFYYNKTVEYYTPVIKAEFRSSQPMSLIIFEAMKEAVANGYRWWNWGGTWASQGGVYHFKSQWGTQDKMYYYYTKIFDETILNKTKEQLLEAYPYFFVAPFNIIAK